MRALDQTVGPEGFNIGYNIGRAAGAGITDHVHQHVVPRWLGDTNFLPVLAGRKTIGEAVEVAQQIGARMTYLIHLTHEVDHAACESTLPGNVRLAYDGLRLEF